MKKEIKNIIENLSIIFIFVILYILLRLISSIPPIPSPSPLMDYILQILSQLILLLIYSIFISIAIKASSLTLKGKFSFKESLKNSKKSFGNFVYLFLFSAINLLFIYLTAKFLSPVLYTKSIILLGLIPVVAFALISPLIIFAMFNYSLNSSFIGSIIRSRPNKKYYLYTLGLVVVYFLFTGLTRSIPYLFMQDIAFFVIIYPALTLVLTYLFENVSSK